MVLKKQNMWQDTKCFLPWESSKAWWEEAGWTNRWNPIRRWPSCHCRHRQWSCQSRKQSRFQTFCFEEETCFSRIRLCLCSCWLGFVTQNEKGIYSERGWRNLKKEERNLWFQRNITLHNAHGMDTSWPGRRRPWKKNLIDIYWLTFKIII